MATLLHIKSSIFSEAGKSNQLAEKFVAQWQLANPQGTVTVRDLTKDTIAHLDGEVVGAFMSPVEERNERQQALVNHSDQLIDELSRADEIVLGAPMYNFSIPSQLKAYFDRIARAGITFKYTETGPVGLLQDRPVTIIATRGGLYENTDNDFQMPFLHQFFNFLGLTQINTVYAEALNIPDMAEPSLSRAKQQINNMTSVSQATGGLQ